MKQKNDKKINKIDASAEYGQEFNFAIDSLNDLLLVKAITQQEFETKKKLLIRKADALVTQTESLKLNQIQVEKLNDALKLGVVSEVEYNSKIKNLSDEEKIIKQKIEQIKN